MRLVQLTIIMASHSQIGGIFADLIRITSLHLREGLTTTSSRNINKDGEETKGVPRAWIEWRESMSTKLVE